MFRFSLVRLFFAVLLVTFVVSEVFLAAYMHRTKVRMNRIYQATEAAAEAAEAAANVAARSDADRGAPLALPGDG